MKIKYPVICGAAADDIDPRDFLDPGASVTGKTLRPYTFVHEGTIAPLIGGVKTVLKFLGSAVRSALSRVKTGIPAFALHEYNRANPLSHEGRKVLASVVGKTLHKARGIVVMAFSDPKEALKYDGISVECEEFDTRNGIVRFVSDITGFALLPNDKYYEPGFPESGAAGAPVQCGVLCAYTPEEEAAHLEEIRELKEKIEKLKPEENNMEITKSQVIAKIKNEGWKPSDLEFTAADVCGNFEVIENGKLEIEGGDPALIKPLRKLFEKAAKEAIDLKEAQKEAEPKLKRLEELDAAAKKAEVIEEAKKKIPELLKARKLDDDKGALEKFLTEPTRLDMLPADTADRAKAIDDYIEFWNQARQDAINPGAGSDAGGTTSSGQDDADGTSDSDIIEQAEL